MRRWMAGALGWAAVMVAATAAYAGDADVNVRLFQFRPAPVEVPQGTRVVWTNQDEITHTVTAGTPERPGGGFDLALDGKGTKAGWEFATPGAYPYFCSRHQSMRGEVRVSVK